ncbi:MAG: hypothetical protein K1X75_09245 [Leptospirales bacterium]|nr:hypothetical protein [Leptospirales bacterium]
MALYQRLLRTFYRTGLPYLAIAQSPAAPGDELQIQAFLSRILLDRLMTDLERSRQSVDRVPAELLVEAPLADELLPTVRKAGGMPVLNESGDQIALWDERQLLQAVASLRRSDPPSTPATAEADAAVSNAPPPQKWLAEMVLQALPMAMFATDLGGRALFYNERFERIILSKDRLRRSLRLAEEYFLELNRNLLARSFERDPERKYSHSLHAALPELSVLARIFNLEQDGRVQGYLYLFQDASDGGVREELLSRLEGGDGLEAVIDDLEAVAIQSALENHGHNISHAAAALQIKRSTLQNKMKRLRLLDRFGPRHSGPIRRIRRGAGNQGNIDPASGGGTPPAESLAPLAGPEIAGAAAGRKRSARVRKPAPEAGRKKKITTRKATKPSKKKVAARRRLKSR